MSNFDSSSDKTKDRKVEVHPQIHVSTPGIQIPPGQQARFAELLSNSTVIPGGLKPQVVSARPLAPAPGIGVATAANVGGKIIGASQHALVPKATGIKAINSSTLEAIALQQQQQQQQHVSVSGGPPTLTQTVAVNLSTQTPPGVGGPPNTQALHITMTTVSSQSLHSLTLPAALGHVTSTAGLVQHQHGYSQVSADKDKSRVTVMTNPAVLSESDRERLNTRIQMESLIRSAVSLPQPLQKGPAQVSLTLAQPAAHQHQAGHGGGAGPTQTSIIHAALPPSHIPRGPAAASALAATKVNAVATPIIRTQALPTASLQGNTLLPTIAAQMAPQAVWKRRTATPPITTTSVAGVHSQQDVRQGHIMTSLPGSVSGGPPAVQISGIAGRPAVLSQQKAGMAVTQAGVVQHGYTGQTQKVVVTQSSLGQTMSQLLAPGSGGPTLVNVSASKIAGQGIALNLAPQQAAAQAGITTQKIITTPVTSLPNQPQGSLANLGPLSLAQPLARGQKVVVPQATNQQSIPPGAVVVNTTAKHGVNVGQAIPRQQKVIMAPTSGIPASIPVTIATVNKTIGIHGGHSTSHLSNISTTTQIVSTQNVTTLPLKKVKVQPQRTAQTSHMGTMALAQHPRNPIVQQQHQQQPTTVQTEHHPATSRDPNTPTAGQVQSKLTLPTSVAPFQGQLQASLFGLQSGGVRVTTANAGAAAAAAATLVGNLHHHQTQQQQQQQQQQQGPQGQERSTLPQTLPFNIPEFHPMYPIVYQTQHPNAGSTIRPGLVAGQPAASLAATLQAATTAVTTVTTTQAGVRLNPSVMVNVDSAHHNTISLGAAQYQGAKPSEVPHIAATNVSLAQSGPTSHPTNLVQATMAHGAHQVTNQQPGPAPSQPTNASPRPSILRKRPHEGERVMIVKRNLLSSVNAVDAPTPGGPPTVTPDLSSHPAGATLASLPGSSLSSMASPKPSHMCDPSRENSQSSTDTASSAESTPQSEVKVKQEPLEVVENGAAAGLALFGQLQNNIEASPRKKPRKQQLDATQELKDGGSSDEELATLAQEDIKQELEWMNEDFVKRDMKEYIDEEGVRWTRDRQRPPVNLLNHYTCNWKTNNNHFQRYQDVKIKDERRPTVNELANQKGIHQKASGWKVYHLAAQLEELMDSERDVFRSMSVVQECIAPKHIAKNPTMEDDISMVHELTQGNIQRCQLVMDQLDEAKSSMVKVLEHKRRIVEIINKHHSKRPVKKKERP